MKSCLHNFGMITASIDRHERYTVSSGARIVHKIIQFYCFPNNDARTTNDDFDEFYFFYFLHKNVIQ